jgi:FkbM family methyltransferase
MSYYTVNDYYGKDKPCVFKTLPNCCISNIIKNGNVWEKHMHDIFEKYIDNESIVIEGGCHIGTHTLKIASLCKHLYAFEPMPDTNKVLTENIILNKMKNVTVSLDGLSDTKGKTKYSWIPYGNPGGSGLEGNPMGRPEWVPETTENIEVNLTTIDSLELDKLDFIKLDVEGYEQLVIKGGMKTISKYKPVITLEVWSNHNGGVNYDYTKTLFKELLEIGYKLEYISGPDFLFIPL